jgi:spore coat protein U-like protein
MKKSLFVVAAIAMVIAMVGGAYAASPATAVIPATAGVLAVCSVSDVGASIAFGAGLDAVTNAAGVAATVIPPSIMCTKSDSVTITDDKGANESGAQMRLNCTGAPCIPSTDYINYSISYTGGLTGLGITTEIGDITHLALAASMAAGALNNVPAGSYADTVTLTIAY